MSVDFDDNIKPVNLHKTSVFFTEDNFFYKKYRFLI